ncbi:hypothetical protein ACU4GD_04775 [Cupriavidus basilensis]
MIDALLFSKPFTFLACPPIAELKEAVDALNALPGHSRWLKDEDIIRRVHVPAFVEQSRQALETLVPGRSLMVDSLSERIRHTPRVLQELREHGPEVAAAAHSYFYWRYLGRRARTGAGHSAQCAGASVWQGGGARWGAQDHLGLSVLRSPGAIPG